VILDTAPAAPPCDKIWRVINLVNKSPEHSDF
jgi:hypothetical protein